MIFGCRAGHAIVHVCVLVDRSGRARVRGVPQGKDIEKWDSFLFFLTSGVERSRIDGSASAIRLCTC